MRSLRLVLLVSVLPVSGLCAGNAPGTWLDTENRSVVAAAAANILRPAELVSVDWTGNMAEGKAGAVGSAYQRLVLERINWARRMAGVPGQIAFDDVYNRAAQQAAILMAANGQLSHNPPSNWKLYSPLAAEAAENSNLCLAVPAWDHGCVFNYLEDHGRANSAVPHRRWLLFPATRKMGSGDVESGAYWKSANALWVVDSSARDVASGAAEPPATRDGFVAWPSKGYFPNELVPARWSISVPDADFSQASVTMSRDGVAVPVTLEPITNGYGDNTLVWIPDHIDAMVPFHPTPVGIDTVIEVTVRRVMVHGAVSDLHYRVILFDPSQLRS